MSDHAISDAPAADGSSRNGSAPLATHRPPRARWGSLVAGWRRMRATKPPPLADPPAADTDAANTSTAGAAASPAAAAGTATVATAGGLHGLLKDCDDWFSREASQLEQRAVAAAEAAAAAGLPRVDVAYDEVPEELELAARCRSLHSGWVERVRTRVRDALQHGAEQAGAGLRRYEGELTALDAALHELPPTRARLKEAEAAAQFGQAEIAYEPFLPFWVYGLIILAIVAVDWIANVPVFTELLPKDPGSEAAWRALAGRSETYGLAGGAFRIFARAVHNIDASLLAFGVIAALVALAHFLGVALRHMTAHSQKDVPTASYTIREQRRQAWVPLVFPVLGIAFLLVVLWEARARLDDVTARAVAEAQARVTAAEAGLETAREQGDLAEIERYEDALGRGRTEWEQRVERHEYATVIAGMNLPILLLNLVLALTALVAAYLATGGSARGTIMSEEVHALRRRIDTLVAECARRRAALLEADLAIGTHLARADYLQCSEPLRCAQAKIERLEAVIPRFRSENARRRGVDTANIAAFTKPVRLNLDAIELRDEPFGTAALAEQQAAHQAVRQRGAEVLTRIETALPLGLAKEGA